MTPGEKLVSSLIAHVAKQVRNIDAGRVDTYTADGGSDVQCEIISRLDYNDAGWRARKDAERLVNAVAAFVKAHESPSNGDDGGAREIADACLSLRSVMKEHAELTSSVKAKPWFRVGDLIEVRHGDSELSGYVSGIYTGNDGTIVRLDKLGTDVSETFNVRNFNVEDICVYRSVEEF